jgi:CubicO group peptidase (beta-lactamase class C family)
MKTKRWTFEIVIALLIPFAPAPAQNPALVRAVDSVFSRFTPRGPGCAVAVYENANVIFAKGYGQANLEYGVPITPTTPFIVGSVSKQFTAAAIALLVNDGRIKLTDDVRKYVPELQDYGTPITVDHLVHHTSGLRDWWELVTLAGLRNDDTYAVQDVLDMTARQRGLNFRPGEQYLYSNTGYMMLGLVVQRVTGKTLREFADERMFKPLGMTATHFHDDHTEIAPGRAAAYSPVTGGGYRINIWNNDLVGQGGVMTTVLDLAKWDENFYTGKVGGPAFLALMHQRGSLSSGSALSYAFGLEIGQYRGLEIVEHTGSTGGYRSVITRFPNQHTTLVALCNVSNAAPATLARNVADVLLRDRLASGGRPAAGTGGGTIGDSPMPFSLPDSVLARFAGRFYSDELGATYEVVITGQRAQLRRPRGRIDSLVVQSPTQLRGGGITLAFVFGSGGRAESFVLRGGRVRDIRFVRR